MGIKRKLFGNLSLDGIKKAVVDLPAKVGEYKGDKQLKVSAVEFDDGGIAISIWDNEKKEAIKLGNLRLSTLDDNNASQSVSSADLSPQEEDLPF